MTDANRITLLRIGVIPVFAALAHRYERSVAAGQPNENLRRLATMAFLMAAITDGLDGYVARRFGQQSRLGALLDPIADKGLMLVALITLGLNRRHKEFPRWFPLVVLGRDALLAGGFGLLNRFGGNVEVKPTLAGKAATALQLLAILWRLLRIRPSGVQYLAGAATLLTVISGIDYFRVPFSKRIPPARA